MGKGGGEKGRTRTKKKKFSAFPLLRTLRAREEEGQEKKKEGTRSNAYPLWPRNLKGEKKRGRFWGKRKKEKGRKGDR